MHCKENPSSKSATGGFNLERNGHQHREESTTFSVHQTPRKQCQLAYTVHTHILGGNNPQSYQDPDFHHHKSVMLGPWSTPSRVRVSRRMMLRSQRQVSVLRRWQSSDASAASTANLPLDGVRVLDVTRVLAGVCSYLSSVL